jgi:hypothetical protein
MPTSRSSSSICIAVGLLLVLEHLLLTAKVVLLGVIHSMPTNVV